MSIYGIRGEIPYYYSQSLANKLAQYVHTYTHKAIDNVFSGMLTGLQAKHSQKNILIMHL